mgnify:CR=1 FL=1|tara:strand:+ start:1490 stop:2002 length:513 start_codon:yes stop_codon:yes gene_type:complete
MYKNFKKVFIIFLFIIHSSVSQSHESVAYINIDYLLNNSIFGKQIINKLKAINEKNINQIKIIESKIKKKETKLLNEKNILSDEVYKDKINTLKAEINKFRIENEQNNKKFQKIKKDEFNDFLNQIQPIINGYMKENSINVLLDKKNIFVGKSELDITDKILNIVDQKIN